MKIVLDLGISPVTVMNTAVIREHYPQLWNDFILPKEVRAILAAFEAYRWISSWKSKDGKIITYPTRK